MLASGTSENPGVVTATPFNGGENNVDGAAASVSFFDGFSSSTAVDDFAEVKVID